MKRIFMFLVIALSTTTLCGSQEWMTSLDVAKRLASVQDKMVLMMWEESTLYPFPVAVNNSSGDLVIIDNLFESEELNQVIWNYFVPVIVKESQYSLLYKEIDDKRSQSYIDRFNDDSFKVMDVNGNLLNSDFSYVGDYLNFTQFVLNYALNTSFLKQELKNYDREKDVNTTFRLASQYIDFAALTNEKVRPEIIGLSTIYLKEAYLLVPNSDVINKTGLEQHLDLLKIKQELILNKPRKVLRQLNRIDDSEIEPINQSLIAFLYFTAHLSLRGENEASQWRSEVSLVNLEKATIIINNNLRLNGNHN